MPSGSNETFVSDEMPPDLPALIESVTFGTSGLRYRRLDVASQIARLHDPVFIGMRDGDALSGAYVLDRRSLLVDGRPVPGVYRGGLCVAPGAQGRGVGDALAERGRAWIDACAERTGEPHLSWGCVDDDNHRSLAVLRRQGVERIGGLTMFALYRQWPRERLTLDALPPEVMRPGARMEDVAALDVTPSRLAGLALVDEHGVRVGARVAVSGYRIETMGPVLDTLFRLTVAPFPPARRRFDPRAFRFVRLSDITLRDGCERDWPAFVSTVLARHGTHFAMTFLDPASRLHARLRRIGPFGPLVHSRRTSIDVMARWALPEGGGEALALPRGPLALPPVDG